ncbi:MAG: P27 family phage terminase small subunit [Phycisphaerae bacterium]|nr:P27 family phage terminase small subunit [Phycisphaerae bacterium]
MAKNIDWEFIRTEYEETTKSVRMIARENNITHGAIQRIAKINKKDLWAKFDARSVVNDKALVSKNPILKKVALRKIKEIKEVLGDSLSPLDEPLIVIFAKAYENWIEFQMEIEEEGAIAVSSKGGEYISALKSLSKMEEKTLTTISNQLGLSISSRKRMGMSTKSDQIESTLFDISKEINEYDLDV